MDYRKLITEALEDGRITVAQLEEFTGVEVDEDGPQYLIDICSDSALEDLAEDVGLIATEPYSTDYFREQDRRRARWLGLKGA